MKEVDNPSNILKYCLADQAQGGQVGYILDPEDNNKKYEYICPTITTRCNNLDDCKKSGSDDDHFCCEASIKFPENHADKIKMCIPRYKEIYPNSITDPKDDRNDLTKNAGAKTAVGEYSKLVEYKDGDTNKETVDGQLTYSYKCPTMLADCQVYKPDPNNPKLYDLNSEGNK